MSEWVPETREEQLALQFYQWERRGRGWRVWPYPVELEPPFIRFYGHRVFQTTAPVDDGHRPLRLMPSSKSDYPAPDSPGQVLVYSEGDPIPYVRSAPLVELQVSFPADYGIKKEASERLLLGLSYASTPLGFELVGLPGSIRTQITCGSDDRDQVFQQTKAYFPEAVVEEQNHFLSDLWDRSGSKGRMVIDCGLSHSCPN